MSLAELLRKRHEMNTGDFQDVSAQEKTKIVDPMIGKVLDSRYEIVRILGQGGMGAVYQARHRDLDKPVAVKIMHPQLMIDDRTVQRFRHEVKAMSTLSHPNLISIMDAGSTEYGAPYFVMEYLPSRSLSEVLHDEVFLSADRARGMLLQIADALLHAHEKGIIHRDLKPPNILIIESAARDHVKVVDLGVAKLVAGDEATLQKLTQTGEVFGSPLYMAPEQILGKKHDLRTDVYQLGCVMFEMLTGVPPHVKPSAIMTMNSHVAEPAPTFNQVMPDLPVDEETRKLEQVALKCLEKDPDARFQSMSEFIQAVEKGVNPPVEIKPAAPAVVKQQLAAAAEDRLATAQRRSDELVERTRNRTGLILAVAAVLVVLVIVICAFAFNPGAGSNQAWNAGGGGQANYPSASPGLKYEKHNVVFPSVAKDRADLQVLSVYEGKQPDNSALMGEREGNVDVDVYKEGKPIILVLNSYMPTTWNIRKANSRVKIDQVISVGYFPQQVKGLPIETVHIPVYYEFFNPDGSKSEKRTHKNAFDQFYFIYIGTDNIQADSSFAAMQTALEKFTRCHLRNFQGVHTTDRFEVR